MYVDELVVRDAVHIDISFNILGPLASFKHS